jgi:hypothetical protein
MCSRSAPWLRLSRHRRRNVIVTLIFPILNLVFQALKLWAVVQIGKSGEEKARALGEMHRAYLTLRQRLTPEELRDEATILAQSHSTLLK